MNLKTIREVFGPIMQGRELAAGNEFKPKYRPSVFLAILKKKTNRKKSALYQSRNFPLKAL